MKNRSVARPNRRADEEQKRRQAEQARAQTERQRRRLALALAAAVVVLVAGAGAAGWWYQQDQLDQAHKQAKLDAEEADRKAEAAAKQAKLDAEEAARQAEVATRKEYLHKEVTTALQAAELGLKELQQALETLPSEQGPPLTVSVLLSDLKQWESRVQTVKALWQQAKKLAESSPALLPPELKTRLDQLATQVKQAEADYQIAQQLDTIHLEASTPVEGKLNTALAGPRYETLFVEKLKLNLRSGASPTLAAQVKGSTLRYVLVAALDHWAEVTTNKDLLPRLLEVACLADPDPWRDQVRNVNTWQNLAQLQELAKVVEPQRQTPAILAHLALRLKDKGGQADAAALLRTALVHHPADFWLNFDLGNLVDDPGEEAGCFRAALAIRPGSAIAHNNLGAALYEKKDPEGAILEFKKAIELDREGAAPHHNLGNALVDKKDLDGAIQEYQKAIELDPKSAPPRNGLGNALYHKEEMHGAIREYKKAIKLDPKFALPHSGLGNALRAQGDLDGAIKEYHKAIKLDPKLALPHNGLGNVLTDQNDLDGAIKEFNKAIALDPKFAMAHSNLGNALYYKKHLDGAIQEFKKAIELDPKFAWAHFGLGAALYGNQDLEGAIQEYQKAIALDPKFTLAHQKLGIAYLMQGLGWLKQGQFAQAEEATLQALKLIPPGHPNHKVGQNQLADCEQGLLALQQKLTAVLQGPAQPKDGLEQLALADLCWRDKKLYAMAVRFYASGLAEQPALAKLHRYHAACAAALAAAGKGGDGDKLDAKGKAKLRQQALTWLQQELDFWKGKAKGDPLATQELVTQLSPWQTDPDLASVRDDKALAQLPDAERKDWQALWADVAKLLEQSKK
jgi:tetratricopeptide (TPR) repeat protein